MAELRRAQLTTLSCNLPFSTVVDKSTVPGNPTPCTSAGLVEGKGRDLEPPIKLEPTVRCVLTLFEPDDRTFPEFSYTELVDNKNAKVIIKDGLEDQENKGDKDEVAAMARMFEEKYGGENKKKKDRIQDLVDIGYGYDDEDSFIDNSEAYDEFVPATLTTKYGGFYVNSGPLQFRQASDTETDYLTTGKETLKPPAKRKLNEEGREKPKKKRCKEPGKMKTMMDSKTGAVSEHGTVEQARKKKKKKKPAGALSVTNMLKKFAREKERERQGREAREHGGVAVSGAVCPADAAGGGGSGLADPLLSLIGSTNDRALIQAASTVDFVMDLDSLLDATEKNSSPRCPLQPSPETPLVPPSPTEADVQTQPAVSNPDHAHPESKTKPQVDLNQPRLPTETKTTAPLLPEGLPPSLGRRIEELTAAANSSQGESKLKFFTPEINGILLDVELQCQDVGGPVRSRVYTYLASFLPCSRDTLLKRIKKLLQEHMDPMQKLKEAIGRAMPEQIARFNDNCQAHAQVKSSKITEGKEREQKGSVVSEDEGVERSGKRGPQKKFRWNEEIRDSLYRVVRAKMDRCEIERTESQQMDDYLKSFLDNEVKPLWPRGWMQPRILLKESRKIFAQPPYLLTKKTRPEKKLLLSSDAPNPPSSSGESAEPRVEPAVSPSKGALPDTGTPLGEDYLPAPFSEGGGSLAAAKKAAGTAESAGVGFDFPARVGADEPPGRSLAHLPSAERSERESPVSQELLAAAMAMVAGGNSHQYWRLGVDLKSPPLPPPPPQCSPVASSGAAPGLLAGPRDSPGNGPASRAHAGPDHPGLTAPGGTAMGFNKV